MKKSEHLFHLIHSLSSAEKRYFRQQVRQSQADANYLRLFDAIQAQEESSTTQLQEIFAGEAFTRQLHVAKNYLYHLILKTLRNFTAHSNRETELRDRIRNIDILFRKELFFICASEIRQAEKTARTYELFNLLLEILYLKQRLFLSWKPEDLPVLKQIGEEIKEILATLEANRERWLALLTFNRIPRSSPEAQALLAKIDADPPPLSQGLNVLSYHHLIRYQLLLRNQRNQEAPLELWNILHAWESRPKLLREKPSIYFNALNNLLGYYTFTKEYGPMQDVLQKIRRAPGLYRIKIDKGSVRLQLRTLNIELEMYRDRKDFAAAFQVLDKSLKFLNTHEKIIPHGYLISFWYQFANVCFLAGDYRQALSWINRILNFPFGSLRLDLQLYTRLLNLFTHLEMGNYMVLGYYLESLKRYIRIQQAQSPALQACLSFFSKMIRSPKSEQSTLYEELYQDLWKADEPEKDREFLDYFDLKSWLQGKLGGHSKS